MRAMVRRTTNANQTNAQCRRHRNIKCANRKDEKQRYGRPLDMGDLMQCLGVMCRQVDDLSTHDHAGDQE